MCVFWKRWNFSTFEWKKQRRPKKTHTHTHIDTELKRLALWLSICVCVYFKKKRTQFSLFFCVFFFLFRYLYWVYVAPNRYDTSSYIKKEKRKRKRQDTHRYIRINFLVGVFRWLRKARVLFQKKISVTHTHLHSNSPPAWLCVCFFRVFCCVLACISRSSKFSVVRNYCSEKRERENVQQSIYLFWCVWTREDSHFASVKCSSKFIHFFIFSLLVIISNRYYDT